MHLQMRFFNVKNVLFKYHTVQWPLVTYFLNGVGFPYKPNFFSSHFRSAANTPMESPTSSGNAGGTRSEGNQGI